MKPAQYIVRYMTKDISKAIPIPIALLLLFLFGPPSQTWAENSPAPYRVNGIYSLPAGNAPITPDMLNGVGVVGVSLRTTWSRMESEEGQWNFDYLDASIAAARGAGKKVMIRVLAGVHTPEWVYARGAKRFEFTQRNPNRVRRGEPTHLPIPWDETYLRYWTRFVQKLGERYRDDPAVVLVHLAGPTRSSAEMHLPKAKEDREKWQQMGYTPKKLTDAWKQVMDVYAQSFPKQCLGLNISMPIYDDGVVEAVLEYGLEKQGARMCLQGNWLSAHTQELFPYYKLIRQYGAKAAIGFQMLGAASWNEKPPPGGRNDREDRPGAKDRPGGRMGNLEVAIQKGLAANARYFEIYQKDIQNPIYRKTLQDLAARLSKP
jgi:hypothetical protein